MMGKDCERMLSSINSIKDALSDGIKILTESLLEPLKTESSYIVYDGMYNQTIIHSTEVESTISDVLSGIIDSVENFADDASKMQSLGSEIYSKTTGFFNSYGSPWTEINRLLEAIDSLKGLTNGDIKYIGQKIGILAMMNTALAYAIDAKWALVTYHDYIQRGFDAIYNDNKPSITHKRTKNQDSTGNLDQAFAENVNVPQASIDPY